MNVIKPLWVAECYKHAEATNGQAEAIPLKPRYMLHANEQTQAEFKKEFDRFGDSFYKYASPLEILEIMKDVDVSTSDASISDDQIRALEAELGLELPWSMFHGYTMLMVDVFDKDDLKHVSGIGMATALLIGGGGEQVDMVDHSEKTHVVVSRGNKSLAEVLKSLEEMHLDVRRDDAVPIVDASWVIDSHNEGRVLLDSNGAIPNAYLVYRQEDRLELL